MAHTPLQRADHQEHHIVSTPISLLILVLLTLLMGLTIWASYWDLGGVWKNNLFAMAIACTKAGLVMWFFMGLRHATGLTRLWSVTGFIVFSLMFIILLDYGTRQYEVAHSWDGRPGPALPRTVDPVGQHTPPASVDTGFRPRN